MLGIADPPAPSEAGDSAGLLAGLRSPSPGWARPSRFGTPRQPRISIAFALRPICPQCLAIRTGYARLSPPLTEGIQPSPQRLITLR